MNILPVTQSHYSLSKI